MIALRSLNAARCRLRPVQWVPWLMHGLFIASALAVGILGLQIRDGIRHSLPPGTGQPGPLVTVIEPEANGAFPGLHLDRIDRIRETGLVPGAVAVGYDQVTLSCAGSEGRKVMVAFADAALFDLLGVHAARGNLESFRAGEGAVIRHDYWQRYCGALPDLVGHRIDAEGDGSWPIAAILPPAFRGLDGEMAADLYLPRRALFRILKGSVGGLGGGGEFQEALERALARRLPIFALIAPMPRGFDVDGLEETINDADLEIPASLQVMGQTIQLSTGTGGGVVAVHPGVVIWPQLHHRRVVHLWLMLGTALLLSLLSFLNLAIFWFTRLPARMRVWRLLHVVGASPTSLVFREAAGLMLFFLVVALAGWLLMHPLHAFLQRQPLFEALLTHQVPAPGWEELGKAAALCLMLGLVAGVLPLWSMKSLTRMRSFRIIGARNVERFWLTGLTAVQQLYAVVLLVVAGALGWQMLDAARLQWRETDKVLLMEFNCPRKAACEPFRLDVRRALDHLLGSRSPRAEAAVLPLRPGEISARYRLLGKDEKGEMKPAEAAVNYVEPHFFQVLHMRRFAGLPREALTRGEAVVNAAFCKRHGLEYDQCLGAVVRIEQSGESWWVGGVVADLRYRHPGLPARPMLYLPERAAPPSPVLSVVTRADTDPRALAEALRQWLDAAGYRLPAVRVLRLREQVERKLSNELSAMRVIGVITAYAVVVALAGTYLRVRERLQAEIRGVALKMAVGATPGRAMMGLVLAPLGVLVVTLFAGTLLVQAAGGRLPVEFSPRPDLLPVVTVVVGLAFGFMQVLILLTVLRRLGRIDLAGLLSSPDRIGNPL